MPLKIWISLVLFTVPEMNPPSTFIFLNAFVESAELSEVKSRQSIAPNKCIGRISPGCIVE
jgi:hypothetical protein